MSQFSATVQANILVDHRGHLYVCDFGLSRMLEDVSLWKTSATNAVGSVRWSAPELLLGTQRTVTKASDLYALGMTCFEIYSGLLPFHDLRHDGAVVLAVTSQTRPLRSSVPSMPEGTWEIVTRCWEENEKRRPQSEECLTILSNSYERGIRATKELVVAKGVLLVLGGLLVHDQSYSVTSWIEDLSEEELTCFHTHIWAMIIDLEAAQSTVTPLLGLDIGKRHILVATLAHEMMEGITATVVNEAITTYYAMRILNIRPKPDSLTSTLQRLETRALHSAVYVARKCQLGEDHPVTLESQKDLSFTLLKNGWFCDAMKVQKEFLQAEPRISGTRHPETVHFASELLPIYNDILWEEWARLPYLEMIELLGDSLCNPDLAVLTCMTSITSKYLYGDRWNGIDALQIASETLKQMKSPEHSATTMSFMENLATAYWKEGRLEESTKLLEAIVDARKRAEIAADWELRPYYNVSTRGSVARLQRISRKAHETPRCLSLVS